MLDLIHDSDISDQMMMMAVVKSDDTTVCLSLCVGRGGGWLWPPGETRASPVKTDFGFWS